MKLTTKSFTRMHVIIPFIPNPSIVSTYNNEKLSCNIVHLNNLTSIQYTLFLFPVDDIAFLDHFLQLLLRIVRCMSICKRRKTVLFVYASWITLIRSTRVYLCTYLTAVSCIDDKQCNCNRINMYLHPSRTKYNL